MVFRVHKNLDLHNISTTVITDAEPSVSSWLWVIFTYLKTYSTCPKLEHCSALKPCFVSPILKLFDLIPL